MSETDSQNSKSVSLIERKTGHIDVYLSAYIDNSGDLILEGQDLGPGVEEHWGDSDYEYWTIVANDRKLEVLLLLINDSFPNMQEVFSWLKTTGVPLSEGAFIEENNEFSVEADSDSITFYQQPGKKGEISKDTIITIKGDFSDRILLLLLQHLFNKELFINDSQFMAWLKKNGIEYKFDSYA
jgi:hypothetical protein